MQKDKKNIIKLKDYSPVSSCSFIECDYDEKKQNKERYEYKVCHNYKCEEYKDDYDKCRFKQYRKDVCHKIQEQISSNKYKIITMFSDKEEKKSLDVFTTFNKEYRTQEYVGIIKSKVEVDEEGNKTTDKDVTITIGSRFDSESNQKFLNYVFKRAFDSTGKIFREMNPSSTPEDMWDLLLMYVFVDQMELAFNQGNYRRYVNVEYNNSNVKGRIDISRHIKLNPMQNGKVAYSTREYSMDNPMNQLILLTYETLKKKYGKNFETLVKQNKTIKDGIHKLQIEIPNYKNLNKRNVLNKISKPIDQLVYIKYEDLRKTSVAILRRLGLNIYNQNSNEVSGVLIAMDKLWEKFLYNVIFKELDAEAQRNIYILSETGKFNKDDAKRIIIPDFYSEKNGFVFDAKYKASWGIDFYEDSKWNSTVREDVFQVLAYMLTLSVQIGGVIYPVESYSTKFDEKKIQLKKYIVAKRCKQHEFYTIPYQIPNIENIVDFNDFLDKQNEGIINKINKLLKKSNEAKLELEIQNLMNDYGFKFEESLQLIKKRNLNEVERGLLKDENFVKELNCASTKTEIKI